MPKEILAGSTDQTVDVFIQNSSSTTGSGLTGLVFNSASLVCYYRKGATGSATALTLATQTVGGAHSDGGFVEIDATNMPGMYRLDLSDTIVATAGLTKIMLKGATNMAPCVIEIEVVSVNKYDATRFGLSALPNAAAAASGGLMILGSNNTAAITIGALTVGAISGTTLTFSGAVAFQSTFAVTTSSSFGALSCSTFTASGAVAFQSTFAVTTSTSLAALSCTTLTASGAVAFQSTLGITGAITATNASNDIVGIDVKKISGSATAADNAEVVYDTDFATNYDSTNNVWSVELGNFAHLGTSFTLSGSNASGVFRVVNSTGPATAFNGTTRGLSLSATAGTAFYLSGTTTDISLNGDGLITGGITGNVGGNVTGSVGSVTNLTVQASTILVTGTHNPQTGDTYARLGAPAGASASADIAAIKAETATIEARGDRVVARCTVGSASTTTSIVTSACSPSGAVADQFKGRIVVFDKATSTAALRGQATDITASSNSATPTLTVTALTTAPSSGDTFSIC